MSYNGMPSWPPHWVWIDGLEKENGIGEIGILKEVALSNVKPVNRCYLYIEHEGSSYVGCLVFDDMAFCRHVAEVLRFRCNRPIAEIGGLELPGRATGRPRSSLTAD
jgi:hypothetical protein